VRSKRSESTNECKASFGMSFGSGTAGNGGGKDLVATVIGTLSTVSFVLVGIVYGVVFERRPLRDGYQHVPIALDQAQLRQKCATC
jgi:hypothetical protein